MSTLRFGTPHRHLAVCESTNDVAREMAERGVEPGAVVTAAEQTAGRGRQGRAWSAPPGKALLYSAVARAEGEMLETLPLAVGVAVGEAIESLRDGAVRVKWPNDVWLDGRKCAGILVEARPQPGWAVIGIGLNVAIAEHEFPEELRSSATSIGGGVSVDRAREAVNEALGRWVGRPREAVLEAFRERDALRGRVVTWTEGSGVAEGVDRRGNLLVRDGEGRVHSLGAGEVHLGA